MVKKALLVLAVLGLFAVPLLGRWFYYHTGRVTEREVPRPDLAGVSVTAPEMPGFVDRTVQSPLAGGSVVVDRAHANRFNPAELSVLQARLAARGQRLEMADTSADLIAKMRYARSLAIISPGESLTAAEIAAVEDFVDKGGRLLLVADPTRFGVVLDDYGQFAGLDSDVSHLNDLAAQFGVLFQSDYLYNTVENEGNFRNIRLTAISTDTLTAGLEQVVFYAAHSIVSREPALISANGDTRSSSSERAGDLPVAVLAADGAVLALGDLTFMTEPYNTTYDNDRLVANIADLMSGARRSYDLTDLPYFFDGEVDLVYAGDPLLDGDLIAGGSRLQRLFAERGKTLTVRDVEDPGRDTLYFGLYTEADDVQPYLFAAGVTLVITATPGTAESAKPTPTPRPAQRAEITPTAGITSPAGVAPAAGVTLTAEVTPTAVAAAEVVSTTVGGRAEVEAIGSVVLSGTAALVLHDADERHVLVVLASTEAGLENAVQRLSEGNLDGGVLQETDVPTRTILALCPTGEVAPGQGSGGWTPAPAEPEEPEEPDATPVITPAVPPPTAPVGIRDQILVVGLDDGRGRYDSLSDAQDYATILGDRYDVTVWLKSVDGSPSTGKLLEYDLVIWAAGDFQEPFADQDNAGLAAAMLAELPIIVSGAYLDETADEAVQSDVQVLDADHPVTHGFAEGEVISFVPAPSGQPYAVNLLDELDAEEATLLMARGPGSESAGAPSVLVLEGQGGGLRLLYIGFPLYLLPDEVKARLVLNSVGWMLGQ